jgi:hypothetical protein
MTIARGRRALTTRRDACHQPIVIQEVLPGIAAPTLDGSCGAYLLGRALDARLRRPTGRSEGIPGRSPPADPGPTHLMIVLVLVCHLEEVGDGDHRQPQEGCSRVQDAGSPW